MGTPASAEPFARDQSVADALRFSAMINLRRNAVCSLAYAEGVKINVIAIVHLSESCTTCSAGNRHHRAA